MPRPPRRSGPKVARIQRSEHQQPAATSPVLQRAIIEILDNQLRDHQPPQTHQTLDRLLLAGHSLDEARRLIACVVTAEIHTVLSQRRPFDETAYVAMLERLPTLPWEESPPVR